jgi:hypothetical protein
VIKTSYSKLTAGDAFEVTPQGSFEKNLNKSTKGKSSFNRAGIKVRS